MIKILAKSKACIFLIIMAFSTIMTYSAVLNSGKVKIEYEPLDDGSIRVINVWNRSDKQIILTIDGNPVTVDAGGSDHPDQPAKRYVRLNYARGNETLWKYKAPKREEQQVISETPIVEAKESQKSEISKIETSKKDKSHKEKDNVKLDNDSRKKVRYASEDVSYVDKINQDAFFGLDSVNSYVNKVNALYNGLNEANDKDQFIIDNNIKEFLKQSRQELELKKNEIPLIAQELISSSNIDLTKQSSILSNLIETLNSRLKIREDAYSRLKGLVSSIGSNTLSGNNWNENIINYSIIGLIIILIIIVTVYTIRRKNRKNKKNPSATKVSQLSSSDVPSSDNPAIVVRRRTTSILKKQCIDDVIDNPAYLLINSTDFTPNSAVRKIFIKNTCIKDVYNLYAEDLRNTGNPKEDGCMVLGRWVYDEGTHTYDISLEDVVLPGDDAVFKEYELNFGGKIKLRIAEKLRKLRRDTNLQYDLVCWIHSHPGLGVFFSNSDDNVQMQLKHSQHPNFLIAFVVDILTSDQEMGIFTFRQDGSMNSKGDLIKMYSLEEMYKWALQSERNSFSPENYFNILNNAKLKMPTCKGVELNNNSIIDLSQIVITPEAGIVGWAVGTTLEYKGAQEYVVSGIVKNSEKPTTGIIGCLISVSYMSLPTIQRLVAHECRNLSFILVYSSKQATLTTIPVISGALITDEQYYGDVTIDDLKIWTRRKR